MKKIFFLSKKLLFSSREIQIYCGSCGSSLVSHESPAQILLIVQTTAIRHSIFYFSFSMFLRVFFFALYLFHPILFYSSFYSLFCFLPLFLHFIFDPPYCFLFKSVILSFLFSYYSVLSASPLCSIPIQSVLFLLVFIHLDPSI